MIFPGVEIRMTLHTQLTMILVVSSVWGFQFPTLFGLVSSRPLAPDKTDPQNQHLEPQNYPVIPDSSRPLTRGSDQSLNEQWIGMQTRLSVTHTRPCRSPRLWHYLLFYLATAEDTTGDARPLHVPLNGNYTVRLFPGHAS
ncbi:hypothetical protein DFP72DRAFT_233055 [Ephemerocybe angulata]|uniref:Uncharacterized protein n=1 Tax=Ephemerocybe angulata TaxID=980116 RepID=A0A8H6I242_9AGAR|nr:hypothetical protein DFP72DRAFT_233055 [Tulosesus angulatus]